MLLVALGRNCHTSVDKAQVDMKEICVCVCVHVCELNFSGSGYWLSVRSCVYGENSNFE